MPEHWPVLSKGADLGGAFDKYARGNVSSIISDPGMFKIIVINVQHFVETRPKLPYGRQGLVPLRK